MYPSTKGSRFGFVGPRNSIISDIDIDIDTYIVSKIHLGTETSIRSVVSLSHLRPMGLNVLGYQFRLWAPRMSPFHLSSPRLSPYECHQCLSLFITMQVQHSYNLSTNGRILPINSHVLMSCFPFFPFRYNITEARIKILVLTSIEVYTRLPTRPTRVY